MSNRSIDTTEKDGVLFLKNQNKLNYVKITQNL